MSLENGVSDEIVEKVALHFYPALKFPLPPANLKTVHDEVRSFLESLWPEPAPVTQGGLWYLAQVLVSMALEDELESLAATLDEQNAIKALTALRAVRAQVEADINAYQGEGQ